MSNFCPSASRYLFPALRQAAAVSSGVVLIGGFFFWVADVAELDLSSLAYHLPASVTWSLTTALTCEEATMRLVPSLLASCGVGAAIPVGLILMGRTGGYGVVERTGFYGSVFSIRVG